MRLTALVVGIASVMMCTTGAQQTAVEPTAFQLVSGDGYEGAIVPASSLWHPLLRVVLKTARGGDADAYAELTPWTPEPADVAATELFLTELLERAAREPAQLVASLPDDDRWAVEISLPWLVANVRTLKRNYWGVRSRDGRRIAIHGVPDDPQHRWRSEPIMMLDGGCANFWLDFNLDQRQLVRLTCGGIA